MTEATAARPELVVFDCDGVLVDSEPIANRVMAEAVTALGWPLTAADCIVRFKGHHLDTVIAAAGAAGMAVLGFAPEGDGADLAAAGARPFRDMAELPGLLGLG